MRVIQSLHSKALSIHGILTLGVMMLPHMTMAQQAAGWDEFEKPIGSFRLELILTGLADIITSIAIPFLVLAFIWVGFLFAAARGNEDKLTKAKNALKWTVIGTAVIASTYLIIDLIQSVFM